MGYVLSLCPSSLALCWPRQKAVPGVSQTLEGLLLLEDSIPTALPLPAQGEAPATSI